MGLFTPYKKRANEFRYYPRFFDPDKERMNQRRKELCGQSTETDGMEYLPGQYIRTQRDARAERRLTDRRKKSPLVAIVLLAFILVFAVMLLPRIIAAFASAGQTHATSQEIVEEFDPYAPITIVPNDYQE